MPHHLQGHARQHASYITRLAFQRTAQNQGLIPSGTCQGCRRFQCLLRRSYQMHPVALQARIIRLDAFSLPTLQPFPRRVRQRNAVALHDLQCVSAGRRVANRRPRRNFRRGITRHIRNQQATHARRMAGGRQPAALDRGEVATHTVHLVNARSRCQQGAAERLFVRQAQARRRQGQQGRAPARNQAQHQITGRQALNQLQHALRSLQAGLVRHRMRRLHNGDPLARNGVAVARHHQPRKLLRAPAPMLLHRLRHGCRCLAGPDHHQPASSPQFGRIRHVRRNAHRGLC